MAPEIHVIDHLPELIGLDDAQLAEQVEHLKRDLAHSNPVAVLTRRTAGGAMEALQTASDRDELLRRTLDQNPTGVAWTVLVELTVMLPPVEGRITCHLLPNGGDRGSGNCFGSDRLLATIPCRGDASSWLRFVIAHEYSHTLRGFGPFSAETVRDHLIFEGLAMVVAEELQPDIGHIFQEEVTEEQVTQFWAEADVDARGLEGYMREMAREAAYEVGARIVRAYLRRQGASIGDAHHVSNRDLYWKSGYPLLK